MLTKEEIIKEMNEKHKDDLLDINKCREIFKNYKKAHEECKKQVYFQVCSLFFLYSTDLIPVNSF